MGGLQGYFPSTNTHFSNGQPPMGYQASFDAQPNMGNSQPFSGIGTLVNSTNHPQPSVVNYGQQLSRGYRVPPSISRVDTPSNSNRSGALFNPPISQSTHIHPPSSVELGPTYQVDNPAQELIILIIPPIEFPLH